MVADAESGVTIPFGSLRERAGGFKCCTDHFLTFYDSWAFYTRRNAIVFRRGSVKTSHILCLRQTLAIPL